MAQSGGGSLTGICTEDLSANPSFDFETSTGHIQTADGNSIFMWGFNLATADFQMPGPILCLQEGATLTINLTNNLPDPTSIVFPGQANVVTTGGSPGLFTAEAAANGGTVTYEVSDLQPGTYLYESGTNPYEQVHMGLYGAIIVRPSLGAKYAYNDPDTEFSEEFLILMHEVDPYLHELVERGETFDISAKHDRYWFINGRSFPDNADDTGVPWLPYQPYGALITDQAVNSPGDEAPILIRYANAGLENHPFHPHGNHMRVIAQDGRELPTAFENFNTTVASGQTYDLLWQWVNVEAWDATGKPIPSTIPGLIPQLLNLVFKDDYTFYSGDAYLGEQGDFQPSTVVDNECGEFYFPWHSHALNEVQNFDEGFGGLLTLVRVDPPGGCQN
jgi:FtsP/CotA-like multicopper oxidase with cupredoxin domain